MNTSSCSQTSTLPFPGGARRLLRRVIEWQTELSRSFDRLLPEDLRIDGNRDFLNRLVPEHLRSGDVVFDVGGGKNPVIGRERKTELRLQVIGLDIDASQLAAAPEGLYDRVVSADINRYRGIADADLVICQALLEHVPDTRCTLEAIASILKPGGRALIFVPSRNAAYARLNLILPEGLKRKILFGIFPAMKRDHGFPAYYDGCTPAILGENARACGLVTERRCIYFHSSYFTFCFPLHAVWRIWLLLFRFLAGAEAAETFAVVFRKQ